MRHAQYRCLNCYSFARCLDVAVYLPVGLFNPKMKLFARCSGGSTVSSLQIYPHRRTIDCSLFFSSVCSDDSLYRELSHFHFVFIAVSFACSGLFRVSPAHSNRLPCWLLVFLTIEVCAFTFARRLRVKVFFVTRANRSVLIEDWLEWFGLFMFLCIWHWVCESFIFDMPRFAPLYFAFKGLKFVLNIRFLAFNSVLFFACTGLRVVTISARCPADRYFIRNAVIVDG